MTAFCTASPHFPVPSLIPPYITFTYGFKLGQPYFPCSVERRIHIHLHAAFYFEAQLSLNNSTWMKIFFCAAGVISRLWDSSLTGCTWTTFEFCIHLRKLTANWNFKSHCHQLFVFPTESLLIDRQSKRLRLKKKSYMNYSDLCMCSVVVSHWWATADYQSQILELKSITPSPWNTMSDTLWND